MTRPPPRRRGASRSDPARRIAYDTLRAVSERGAYANLVLPGLLAEAAKRGELAERDAGFATELAYGTLRGQGTYDAVLDACLSRPREAVDSEVVDLLRLGVHQLLAMRVPSHAAVDATVELARAVLGRRAERVTGFINAVLRKVARQDLAGWVSELTAEADDRDRLAVEHAHPRWIVDVFAAALPDAGSGGDELAAVLAADNVAAAVTLAVRPGRAEVSELERAGAEPGRWSPYAAVLQSGSPSDVAAVREGRAGVQDEGSQLVALALASAPVEGRDERWLDLCAGPGGKSALLAGILAARPGGRLVANEVQPHRAQLVARAVAGAPATVITGDGRRPPWQPGSFDRVLVDAPCTGLGALRRRPEARWRRTPQDLADLAPLQRELLVSALESVRPGGVVAYVTCSPHPAETRDVVDAVLAGQTDVTEVDARPYLPAGMPDLGAGPDVQLWPHRHGTDAMYVALLRREDRIGA